MIGVALTRILESIACALVALSLCLLWTGSAIAQQPTEAKTKVSGKRIHFVDGGTLDVDEAWTRGTELWYQRGSITESSSRKVKSIEDLSVVSPSPVKTERTGVNVGSTVVSKSTVPTIWVHLVGGARFRVDHVRETVAGAWYDLGSLSAFVDRERIARIERDTDINPTKRSIPDWTSGNSRIDELIRLNGERYGVDPYLVFLVIEHESHFRPRAVSPKGARGLMQLMPGTARRFGVQRPFDVGENIRGGTRYLKELMEMWNGQVNLVLASYNAGEGAVMKYGRKVPPYSETREYVRRIGKRYGLSGRQPGEENPQR